MQKMPEENKPKLRQLVRICNTDMDGSIKLHMGLARIKGVSFMFSNMVCAKLGLDREMQTGALTDSQIAKIDDFVRNPAQNGAPSWMLNRRKDPEDGSDKHIIGGNIPFVQGNDIKILKKIKSYRGIRHIFNLPVRGQKTRSNFRKNKGKVSLGVTGKAKPGKK